jgi:hypothetical protein
MLKPDNREFKEAVAFHKTFGGPSRRLQTVLDTLEQCQVPLQPYRRSQDQLFALLTALYQWRIWEGGEYADRGSKDGVAYRLWMETKQLLKNIFDEEPYQNQHNPPRPTDCPGDTIMGVYVPPASRRDSEICHAFAYRGLVASGRLLETHPADSNDWGAQSSMFLYPGGVGAYLANSPARANGVVLLQPGDLIGMFLDNTLVHSLIAVTATQWIAANNFGTFGDPTGGRTLIDSAHGLRTDPHQVGWVDLGHQFRRVDGQVVDVIYRRLAGA